MIFKMIEKNLEEILLKSDFSQICPCKDERAALWVYLG